MGGMINGLIGPSAHNGGVDQVAGSKQNGGNANGVKQANLLPGKKVDHCKNDSRYSTRCAQAGKGGIMHMPVKRRQISHNDPTHIQHNKMLRTNDALQQRPEKVQGNHIKNKVHRIDMHEAGSDEPIALPGVSHYCGVKQ